MQRIANPLTRVRFTYTPPNYPYAPYIIWILSNLTKKISMIKVILIIIGMIFLITFTYYGKIDGYLGRIGMFIT